MEKIYNIILWGICFVLLSHNSACVSMTTGALEGAIEKQERTNRVEAAASAVGLDQGEFNSLERKMNRVVSCIETVENGSMTKDLAILIGKAQKFLTTSEFLKAIDSNLKKKLK